VMHMGNHIYATYSCAVCCIFHRSNSAKRKFMVQENMSVFVNVLL